MKEYGFQLKQFALKIDFWILGTSIGMCFLSILTLLAGSDRFGTKRPLVQALALGMGVVCMLILALVDIQPFFRKLAIPLFVLSVVALLVVMVLGTGASAGNWLKFASIGLSLQPSEFVKFFFLITFSQHLEKVRDHINSFKNFLLLCCHGGCIVGMVVLSGDLGSALVFACMMLIMMYMAGLSLWYFLGMFTIVMIALPIVWPFLATYQQERIIYGFHPELDPIKWGFQPLSSKEAIIFGGFKGTGFDGGVYYKIIPAAQSDMLFGVLGEKFGFLGTFSYIAMASVLIIRLLLVARNLNLPSSKYITVGVAAMLMAQMLENIGMCLALLPVVGITLPLFSYGGSSILSICLCLGLVQNAETHNSKYFIPVI